jgi:hypothetical protein
MNAPRRPASAPTQTAANSPERLAVYKARFERGEELHHPDDFAGELVNELEYVDDDVDDDGPTYAMTPRPYTIYPSRPDV